MAIKKTKTCPKKKNNAGPNIMLDGKKMKLSQMPADGLALMRELGVSPQEAVMKVDGQMRPEGTALSQKSRVEIIRVVFGG